MNPRADFLLAIAPHFHLPVTWAERVTVAETPGGPWRAAGDEELSALLAPASAPAEVRERCLCLLGIPQHLRSMFWQLIDQAEQAGAADLPGFDVFAEEVRRFLAFKQLELPREVSFELLVRQPAQGAEIPNAAPAFTDGLCGAINLGDAPFALNFGNTPSQLLARVRIDPGEGFRLPRSGPPVQIAPPDTDEPELLLLVRDKVTKS